MTPARLAAVRVLVALDARRTTMSAELERERPELTDRRDQALFLELAAGTTRWRAALDARLAVHSRRPLADLAPELRAILRLATYQLHHLDRIPEHAIVHQSVEAARALGQARATTFVNAVLRNMIRARTQKSPLPPRPPDGTDTDRALDYLAVTLSHPRWLVARWLARVGFEACEKWCLFNNASPDIGVRALEDAGSERLLAMLAEQGVEAVASRFVPGAVLLPAGGLGRLSADIRHQLVVQDEGSQLVGRLAGGAPNDRVLDVCASPGGKTLMLAHAVGPAGVVIAGDVRPARVALLRATLDRGHVPARVLALDAARDLPFGDVFDRVLLDAPCSGLGTLRRDPDIKWTRRPEDLTRFASRQQAMLAHAAQCVRPGGALIYATCSSEPEENDEVVQAFLRTTTEFELGPLAASATLPDAAATIDARGLLHSSPAAHALDAFFAALLVRRRAAWYTFLRPMRSSSRTAPVRRRVWKAGRFLVVMGALVATYGVFFLAGLRVTTHAREVKVPDLHGKSVTDANKVLADLGLVLRIDEPRRPDKAVPADHVLSQEPEAGFVVRRARAVRVRISDGQREPVLPVVSRLPEKTAEDTLTTGQVAVGYRAEVRTANYPPGAVVAQDPDAGQRAATVNLLINRGDAGVGYVVPDLIGTLAAKATEVLRAQNFRVVVGTEVPYPGLPPGVVVRQTPQPGYRIQQSELITLEVSK